MLYNRMFCFNVVLIAVSASALMLSCRSSTSKEEAADPEESEINIVQLDPLDPAYRQQLKNARDSLNFFTGLLKQKNSNRFDFFAKAAFADGDKTEHLWFSADSLIGSKIAGLLDNEPVALKNIRYKDRVSIDLKEVEDWAIYDKDSLVAGNFITYE